MAEVMNRAARRAAGMGKKGRDKAGMVPVRVRNRVAIVPMEHLETYYADEIASEGNWASDVPVIIRLPAIDSGRADSDWFPRTLERMWDTRRRKGTMPVKIGVDGGSDIEIDVGLVDVTVFFEMPGDKVLPLLGNKSEADRIFFENCRHLESLDKNLFHDQMILAMSLHTFHSNGSLLLHIHNLIFGMRMEVRGDVDILGPLDMDPLLKKLARSGPLSVIGGQKP